MLQSKEWSSGVVSTFSSILHSSLRAGVGLDVFDVSPLSPDDSSKVDWITPDREISRLLVNSFRCIPEVVSICAQFGNDGNTVWTLLKEYDRDARDRIYDKELEICNTLRLIDFDFRVTSIELVSQADLVACGSREIFKRQ